MTGSEELGRPFAYELESSAPTRASTWGNCSANRWRCAWITPLHYRYWNGIVTDVGFAGSHGRHALYRVTLRPGSRSSNAPPIAAFFRTNRSPLSSKPCSSSTGSESRGAQRAIRRCARIRGAYAETDFDFVSRPARAEGFITLSPRGRATRARPRRLVQRHSASGSRASVFIPDIHRASEIESDDRWELRQRLIPAAYVTKGYDFERPLARPESTSVNDGDYALKGSELFDYSGAYLHPKEAEEDYKGKNNETPRDVYTRVRLETVHASFEQIVAHSNARGLAVGSCYPDGVSRPATKTAKHSHRRRASTSSGENPSG